MALGAVGRVLGWGAPEGDHPEGPGHDEERGVRLVYARESQALPAIEVGEPETAQRRVEADPSAPIRTWCDPRDIYLG